jgi:thiol-disulfide isomerase/thioredoxin
LKNSSLASAAIFTICLALLTPWTHAADLKAGDPAPDLLGQTMSNDRVTVSQFKGKALVVSFWATWCTYCLKELPILNDLQKAGTGRLQVVAVNVEDRAIFRKVSRALASFDIKQAYDPEDIARDAYGVHGIPHLVVIDREGKIRSIYRGYSESMVPEIVATINAAMGATN